jgi:hypothetical protein
MGSQRESTPASVTVNTDPRPPERDPTLGIPVEVDRSSEPVNRLVTIGDSISQGFMSAAVFRTDRSWPAIVAHELGLRLRDDFRYPVYEPPSGPGGLPLDLERAVRGLESVVGDRLDWHELIRAGRWLRRYMDRIEDYWEGRGDEPFELAHTDRPYHNLSVYGADLVDAQVLTAHIVEERLGRDPRDDLIAQIVDDDNDRAWRVVLDACSDAGDTVLDAAREMGDEGPGPHGIETLVVMLGANNALGSVVQLAPRWTPDDYLDEPSLRARLDTKGPYNVWQPDHFADEWRRLVTEIRSIAARHVILATIPQVTIAPIARGVRGKAETGSRFFPYYTRPWISDEDFDVDRDPWIDEDQARGIDSAIDAYNEEIISTVRAARSDPDDPRDWYLFDLGALLDSIAIKRYAADPEAQPSWWEPYEFPDPIAALRPPVDTRFFASNAQGRQQGGLFSLDGVHPTTIASGIVADEIIRIMDGHAHVTFRDRNGVARPQGGVSVDFDRVVGLDSLNSDPPTSISSTLALLGWFDERLDWVRGLIPFGR